MTPAPTLERLVAAAHPSPFDWRRAIAYGPLLGVVIAVMETSVLPVDVMTRTEWLKFEAGLLALWAVAGMALASATMLLERRLRLWMMAPALIAFSLLISASWVGGFGYDRLVFPSWIDSGGRLHVFWSCTLYGGLFVFTYRLSMQSERTRQFLGRAEIARQQTENLFSEARLLSLQGHIDPAFLLRVMVEVERRYACEAVGMGRLLDSLVSFLRAAMPGVRSGASTLAVEMLLAEHYAQVWAELEPSRPTWAIHVEGTMPELPFPSLLLLPVLDQLATAGSSARRIEMQVAQRDGHCILTLAAGLPELERRLTPGLMYRLQVGLHAVFGDVWTLQAGPSAPAIVLKLPLAGTGIGRRSAVPFPPDTLETSHG